MHPPGGGDRDDVAAARSPRVAPPGCARTSSAMHPHVWIPRRSRGLACWPRHRVSSPREFDSSRSSVAHRAAKLGLDVILLNQLRTHLDLIGWRLPVHIEQLIAGPNVLRRVHVAVDAEAHLKTGAFSHERLLIDLSVAGRAADSLVDVDAVIKVDVIRKIVDGRPLDRLAGAEAVPNG